MKVKDIMRRSIITVSEDTPLKEIGRLIFSLGLAGLPVVRGKKLVGIVTEKDILGKFHPSVIEYMEDPVNAGDFTKMEKNLRAHLDVPAKDLMSKSPTTISPDTSLVEAQSIMAMNHISRLPIIDKEGNLAGIISQGDIFRELLKNEIPQLEKERYAGFIARNYDLMVNWQKRFNEEFPVLLPLFKKNKVKSVLDVGTWTGEYTIGLAKKGPYVLGLDNHKIMIEMSNEKLRKLSPRVKKNVGFMLTDYSNFSKKLNKKFDAAICMGNSLPYIPVPLPTVVREVSRSLRDKDAIFVIQLLNFEKILKQKNRLLSFAIQKSKENGEREHMFIEFFDEAKDKLIHHVVIFDSEGESWIYKGITSIDVYDIRKVELERVLRSNGFSNISFAGNLGEYQGEYGKLSFTKTFDPGESDWLNVVAKR